MWVADDTVMKISRAAGLSPIKASESRARTWSLFEWSCSISARRRHGGLGFGMIDRDHVSLCLDLSKD
jgi:hypothetical protein